MSGVIEIKNLDAFERSVELWFSEVARAAEQAAVGLAYRVFERAVWSSPQFSGDFAANWKVNIGSPDASFTQMAVRNVEMGPSGWTMEAFKQGDPEAISYAHQHGGLERLRSYKLGQTIFVSNSAWHRDRYEGSDGVIDLYGWKIEKNEINFRPGNRDGGATARRAAQFVANRFTHIGASQLAVLKRVGV